ncbi:hypothetical protein L1987_37544 [Smallanthus sonchifolius]|uniref:Uncharacterized protein n=1 Tax=Smallanthus sonchifolius TaxID=185202 RepID=A0ACB9HG78_9ASTR|nr:hypothetical protein L1987_37544 [Smallanthus sonchifolius]
MTSHRKNKILIVAYPNQGHINPSLHFAHRLLNLGVDVTYSTSLSVIRRIDKETTSHYGLTFAPFSDGQDNGHQPNTTLQQFFTDFATYAVAEIITSATAAGKPFGHLVYTNVLPWAAKVAKAHGLESTLLWCQSATMLNIYYHYFNGYEGLISCNNNNPSFPINLPGLPSFTISDLPSFFSSSSPKEHDFILEFMKEHIDVIKVAPRILVNPFDELEIESIRAIEKLELLPVGPLVPLYDSLGCDLFDKPEEGYIEWLNTKPKSSVVYVSFGSLATLPIDQAEEIASGLLESRQPFLWVIRDGLQAEKLGNIEVLRKQGMIVGWCSQVEVLNHQAIGCFLTHCDQREDVWKIGVKVKRRDGDGMVEGKEIKRCVEMVMEDGEMWRNAKKWRELARQALDDGGRQRPSVLG